MPGFLIILLLLMIVAALVAIETSNLLSSIVSVGAVGFLLSIAFLILAAPDIAITQIVVEILCLIILIRATISRDLTAISGDRELFGMIATVTMVLVAAVMSVHMFEAFPPFGVAVMDRVAGAPSTAYLRAGWEKTGAANAVTAVLLDFRAYDTLGEATVLFCAILGALTILRRKARKRAAERDED